MVIERFSRKPFYLFPFVQVFLLLPLILAYTKFNKFVIIGFCALAAVLFMSTFWAIKSLIFQCYSKNANGKTLLYENTLVPIREVKWRGRSVETFVFNRQSYLLEKGTPVLIEPKTDFSLAEYLSIVEQQKEGSAIHENYELFSENSLRVPPVSFISLFKEQCVTPLFCFQVFSSLLMCFDEHIMQSLFSTFMIVAIEAGLVFTRVHTIKLFRSLEQKPFKIVKLSGKNTGTKDMNVDTVELRPGDIVKISSAIAIPCDLLVIKGSCAVNEAMLSGESVPIAKEEIVPSKDIFSFSKHKRNVLFSGTTIEKINEEMTCIVLRTGFGTEQGKLLNKMLISEDIKYDPEALKFIFILTGLSLISCAFTFFYSKKTGFPLFIDLIVLFTSAIPFELPMEMAMSVQTAVKNLAAKKIFCLEPFRITLAGKIDVCCFDKTGTLTKSEMVIKKVVETGSETKMVLATCLDLTEINGVMRGDVLDVAMLQLVQGIPECKEIYEKSKILKQYPFSSELRRHATVSEININNKELVFSLKGAPEAVGKLCKRLPENYERDYQAFASSGYRVISLAYKKIESKDSISKTQQVYENNLNFAGFILLGCALQKNAREMAAVLRNSGHKLVMITGDNLLTAKSVAEQIGMGTVGVEGSDIENALEDKSEAFYEINIFARADPSHKERIIKKYKMKNCCTMMVGDGTNDVGALKAADVGVAMLESNNINNNSNIKNSNIKNAVMEDTVPVKPGDASVAAPFTIKSNDLLSIVEIIQQGRSSLVTTIQMYKILALNAVVSSFLLMAIDIIGVKFSEMQSLAMGMLSAIAFSAITSPKTLPFIAKQRPQTTIFSKYIHVSITGQALIHALAIGCVMYAMPWPEVATKFAPSVMNTAMFALCNIQNISIFICNYIGRPFRENILENKIMSLSLLGIVCVALNVFLNVYRDINVKLEIVSVGRYSIVLLGIIAVNFVLNYLLERACYIYFLVKK
ncbi:manganese-transporting P-type ATPase [Enteropsectra breve]|nr:manganese-transporting P-type ATPase [Enteropsectra breve]